MKHSLLLALLPCIAAQTFFVSPSGSDSNPGTLAAPFLTPLRANQAVAALPRPLTADVRVELRAGTYELPATLWLGPGSGGDGPSARVIWEKYASDSGEAVLSGGATVQGWAAVAGTPGVWRAPLPAAAPLRSRALFEASSNTRRWPARLPALPPGTPPAARYSDEATLHYVGLLDGSSVTGACWGGAPHNDTVNQWGFVYNASDARLPSAGFADVAGLDVLSFGAWTASWARVAAIVARNATLLTATPLRAATPGHWGGLGCPAGARYILSNVREALLPGSGAFYVEDATRMLYYAPLPGEDIGAMSLVVPLLPTILNISGDDCGGPLGNLVLQGLALRHTSDGGAREEGQGARALAPGQFAGITIESARDVTLLNVSLSSMDSMGISLLGALLRVSILGSSVAGVGGDGIGGVLSRSADALNTTIANCSIAGTGMVFMNQPAGIRVQGAAEGTVRIAHNVVRESTYAGIMVGWQAGRVRPAAGAFEAWQFVVEGNLVEDCGLSTLSDFGGIYTSTNGYACERTQSCYIPTLVKDNLVRGIRGYNYGGEGFYADENVAGVLVTGNVLGNVSGTPVYLHCGDNQTVVNNLLHGAHASEKAGGAFARGLLGGCNSGGVSPDLTNTSAFISTNIFLVSTPGGTLFNSGNLFPTANETYQSNVYFVAPSGAPSTLSWPLPPAFNATFQQWQAAGEDTMGAVADPLVADLQGGDFRLLPGSPALARGFQQLVQGWGPQ